jgi:hypothetical protein
MNRRPIISATLCAAALAACQGSGDMPAGAPAAPPPAAQTPPAQTPPAPMPAAAPERPLTTNEVSLTTETRWVTLFAGQDLTSFDTVGGANWAMVDDTVQAVDGEGGFLVTRGGYGDFLLRLEFWTSPDANSGIFIRCQDASEITAGSCYEVNIFDQRPDPTYRTGGIVNFAEPMAQIDAGNQWNTYEIRAEGTHIVVTLNDTVVVDFEDDTFAVGAIALQWGAGTVRFRNVLIRPL